MDKFPGRVPHSTVRADVPLQGERCLSVRAIIFHVPSPAATPTYPANQGTAVLVLCSPAKRCKAPWHWRSHAAPYESHFAVYEFKIEGKGGKVLERKKGSCVGRHFFRRRSGKPNAYLIPNVLLIFNTPWLSSERAISRFGALSPAVVQRSKKTTRLGRKPILECGVVGCCH